jgi:hypothetical protein
MVEFPCPVCGFQLTVNDEDAGRTTKCTNCGDEVDVPLESIAPVRGIEGDDAVLADGWYMFDGGQTHGPLPQGTMRELAAPGSLVWHSTLPGWLMAGTLQTPPASMQLPPLPKLAVEATAGKASDAAASTADAVADGAGAAGQNAPPTEKTPAQKAAEKAGLPAQAPWAHLNEEKPKANAVATQEEAPPPKGMPWHVKLLGLMIVIIIGLVVTLIALRNRGPKVAQRPVVSPTPGTPQVPNGSAAADDDESTTPATVEAPPPPATPDQILAYVRSLEPLTNALGELEGDWGDLEKLPIADVEAKVKAVKDAFESTGSRPNHDGCKEVYRGLAAIHGLFDPAINAWKEEANGSKGTKSRDLFNEASKRAKAFRLQVMALLPKATPGSAIVPATATSELPPATVPSTLPSISGPVRTVP